MVISAVTRVATKILAKQKYAKTAREWRKKNPDKIKAQKKRYYAAHKEQLIKEQKQWRKDNPEKARQLVQAAKERQPKPAQKRTFRESINKPKLQPGIFAVWTREQKSQGGSGTTMFSSFLKGSRKLKPVKPRIFPQTLPVLVKKPRVVSGLLTVGLEVPKKKRGRKPKFLGFGGVFGGLAAYANWGRGKKQ